MAWDNIGVAFQGPRLSFDSGEAAFRKNRGEVVHSGVFCWSLDHGEKRMKGDMNPEVVDLIICLLAVRLF